MSTPPPIPPRSPLRLTISHASSRTDIGLSGSRYSDAPASPRSTASYSSSTASIHSKASCPIRPRRKWYQQSEVDSAPRSYTSLPKGFYSRFGPADDDEPSLRAEDLKPEPHVTDAYVNLVLRSQSMAQSSQAYEQDSHFPPHPGVRPLLSKMIARPPTVQSYRLSVHDQVTISAPLQ